MGSFATVFKIKSLHKEKYTFAAKTYFKETYENSQHKEKFIVNILIFFFK
jgi:hypothetical protein